MTIRHLLVGGAAIGALVLAAMVSGCQGSSATPTPQANPMTQNQTFEGASVTPVATIENGACNLYRVRETDGTVLYIAIGQFRSNSCTVTVKP